MKQVPRESLPYLKDPTSPSKRSDSTLRRNNVRDGLIASVAVDRCLDSPVSTVNQQVIIIKTSDRFK